MTKGRAFTPYQTAARLYFGAGWSPIPLKLKEKHPVPDNTTGAEGKYVDELQLKRWLNGETVHAGKLEYKAGNVALRLPRHVIGIDVDTYDGKVGAATLAEAEERWGKLPKTWASTSKHGTGSGIRFFRIPEGLAWPGQVGPGIEIIRWDHRYAMVFPSIHDKTGARYEWITPKGKIADGYAPAPSELTKLPKAWVKGLTSGKKWVARAFEDMDDEDMTLWLSDRPEPDDPCDSMRALVKRLKLSLMKSGDDGGGHDSARDAVWGVLQDSGGGHEGVRWALGELRKTFLTAVAERRGSEREAVGEWKRIVQRGMGKVAGEGDLASADPCRESIQITVTSADGKEVSAVELSEQGNAERLAEVVTGRLRWAEDQETWRIWDDKTGLWREDPLQAERWAVKAANVLRTYIEDQTIDPKVRKKFVAHFKSSERPSGLRSTLEMYRARPGVALRASDFDSRRDVLACPNGMLTLDKDGASFRPLLMRDDHVTLTSAAQYLPARIGSEGPGMWDEFLERVQPDIEVRAWLARLVGYSLLGHNEARKIIVCMGPTSSGKGTFMTAVLSALGTYGGTANLTIFRDNQDERPRADLADVMMKRIIFCDEASHNWKLHPDQIKRMTGAGAISARRPFARAAVTAIPAFTPWLMTNSVPSIEGADKAVRRRLVVVPFGEEISAVEEDSTFATRLAEQREAILVWAVAGYNELMSMGMSAGLEAPMGAWAIREEFTDAMSNLDSFIAECCVTGSDYAGRPDVLADQWIDWQTRNDISGRDKLSVRQFALALNANGYVMITKKVDGKAAKVRQGIDLNSQYEVLK